MLSNYRLLSCNGNELTLEELNKLFEFYNMMSGSLNSRFIFRGESNRNLMRQFNFDTRTPDMLSECLFMTGEKGRICWADNEGINPDDVSTENFLRICTSLAKYIDEGLRAGGNRAKRIKAFCEKEEKFYDGINNGKTFVGVYEKLKPEEKRKVFRCQLRSHPGRNHRLGAVRARERLVHRSYRNPQGLFRGGERRHPFP